MIFVISDTIFIIKKTVNKIVGCWSIDIADQYIAPITVIKQMIQKKLLFFSIVYSSPEKSHKYHSHNGKDWYEGRYHSNKNVNICFFHTYTAFLSLL